MHPKAYTDAVITIAYHLLHGEKVQTFTIQDIAECLSKCRAEKPKNLSDVLAGCARNGWLAEGSQKQRGMKSWYLTSTGEKYFPNEIKSGRNRRLDRRREGSGVEKGDQFFLHCRQPCVDRLIGIDRDFELSIRKTADPPWRGRDQAERQWPRVKRRGGRLR
ncbi:MAG: hypothetical protein MPW15_17530 [Candidatus Manganitrophus sp.]|nr:hypothetical protein [Candidatus Manganitrophus sp.]